MNNKQRLLAGALLIGGGVVLGALAINMADNSTSKAQQKQMSPAVQVLQPSEQSAIPAKEDTFAPVELKELPHGGSPTVVNTVAEQMAKKAEIDRLSRHYQEAELKAQEAQRSAQQLQQASQNKSLLAIEQQGIDKKADIQTNTDKQHLAEQLAQAEAKRKVEVEKKHLDEQVEEKPKIELADNLAVIEKKRQTEVLKAEVEKKRLAEQADAKRKAEIEKKRQAELVRLELEKKRLAEIDKKRQVELAKAEAEKKRLAEQAEVKRKMEAYKKRKADLATAEVDKKRQAEQLRKEAKNTPNHALWMVQIALADQENAGVIAAKLRAKGYRVTLSPTSKGVRVLVGPHKDRAAADSVRQRIASDGRLNMGSAWVHSWVPLEYRK